MINFIRGDIHDIIKTIKTDSIDFIYTDPPFGITGASWDKGLNWKELFPEMWRVLKPTGIICLYASIPLPMNYYNMKNLNIIIRGLKIIRLDSFRLNINH